MTFFVDAVSIRDWLGAALPYDRQARIFDPDALAFILVERVAVGQLLPTDTHLNQRRSELQALHRARLQDPAVKEILDPLVLRANAGDCLRVDLANRLPAQVSDAAGDALLPTIVSLNVDQSPAERAGGAEDLRPSSFITLHPQLVTYNVAGSNGAAIGQNGESPIGPGERRRYYWYAGVVTPQNGQLVYTPQAFGPATLSSWGDVLSQPLHGLIGALIVEPAGATYYDPASGAAVPNGGISAIIRYPKGSETRSFREHVVMYRDGLNLHDTKLDGTTAPIPDCLICDDSYDLGDKAFNHHTAPFAARLGQAPDTNLNGAFFPAQFFTPSFRDIPTTDFTAMPGEEVRFHVLQPSGRSRQHAFLLYGHDFLDMLPDYGSPHSPLISVGKATTVTIPSAHEGYWLYRDGPTQMWSGGLWGSFTVGQPKGTP